MIFEQRNCVNVTAVVLYEVLHKQLITTILGGSGELKDRDDQLCEARGVQVDATYGV